jgi:hypothetical protein
MGFLLDLVDEAECPVGSVVVGSIFRSGHDLPAAGVQRVAERVSVLLTPV